MDRRGEVGIRYFKILPIKLLMRKEVIEEIRRKDILNSLEGLWSEYHHYKYNKNNSYDWSHYSQKMQKHLMKIQQSLRILPNISPKYDLNTSTEVI